ncbi:hypothetical protein MCEL_28850 [Mycolicibacterium celeriflavum]|uniref:Uncharacterized protein n=1 Tax=Mycolicibacterium celeriflavum TaxID=1249101 RepID=A0A7I7RJW7_MYCCF|nr:hypothetical protein MCEL_28850 [Mycolicibacterium celeriflavum]
MHDLLQSLGIQPRRELHRADYVGEQHRYVLVFTVGLLWRNPDSAGVAEARSGAEIMAT